MTALTRLLAFATLLAVSLPGFSKAQSEPVRDGAVEARLISSHSTITPGQTFTIGLKLKIDETWHTYWINPGETGKPTTLDLTLPEGFSASELQFPVPKRFITDYGFNILEAGFGYEKEVIHPMTITAPDSIKAGDTITIQGRGTWLMCDPSECVPGKGDFSLTLQVGNTPEASAESATIEKFAKKLPEKVDWATTIALDGDKLVSTVAVPEGTFPENADLHFYPYEVLQFDQLAETEINEIENGLSFATLKHADIEAAPETFDALIIAEVDGLKAGFHVSTEPHGSPALTEAITNPGEISTADDERSMPFGGGIFGILLAAFLGGMILNVMPCVFPVISLKVLSFVGQAGEDRKKVFAHALSFTLGVLVFFWILTTGLLIVRASVGEVGWGEQLQQPAFVIGLIFVMILVALNLFGVFEVGTSLTGVGGGLTSKEGYGGSFWSGALAVLLATPCTAPLMAPAITFALSQSAPFTIIVFTSLGLGMAAPYFLFAIFPKLLDVLPAPGAWMETFKQFMGFPMLVVAVWLIGVLSKQLNVSGLQWSLAAVVLLALAGWILGRYTGFDKPGPTRLKGRIAAALVFLLSVGVAYEASGSRAEPSQVEIEDVIARKQAEGKNVFVDFTAEWCVTCKVNERTTIKTDKTQEFFDKNNIELVFADWTNQDPAITKLLKEHGRAGVPLYVMYPADPDKAPIALPDGLITFGHIEDAFEKLEK
ncbi:MAG: thioredoxin family protein [Verrucomicrobiales bacterium]|nr:thioredoxin family protein [Verrucomicrobiales bacterium]